MFARSVVAAFVAAPLLAQVAFAADCVRQYTVQEGDWCNTISSANNVSTYQLAAVNQDVDQSCDNLLPGQQLCLGTDGEDCQTTHVVKAGDSCDAITATYGLNSTVLIANNPQIDADCNIYIGEVLCVANTVIVPSVTGVVIPAVAPTPVPAAASSTPAAEPTDDGSNDEDEDDLEWCD
ncbi:hypothetical protein BD413DRAFT_479007 [Trametes elegans]|nr:hypothetical protein BD413DRAFT_479007 [Trametes elegans]